MARTKDAAMSSGTAATTATGDHTAEQLLSQSNYRDNPDKPAPDSIAQVQDVPANWPGAEARTEDQIRENADK